MSRSARMLGVAGLACGLVCCAGGERGVAAPPPGSALAGLSAAELQRFEAGKVLFQRQFTPLDGLGPLFNEDRCSSCHDLPALGGTGVESELKAARFTPPDACDLLTDKGGDVFEDHATPALRRVGIEHASVPAEATGRTRLLPPELYGLGLVEAITDSTLRALAERERERGNGIAGRVGRTAGGAVGRFGHKADQATIDDFVQSALIGEMGLTSPRYPAEKSLSGRPLPRGTDPAPDPEITRREVALLADFVRFLAPPAPVPPGSRAEADSVQRGAGIFRRIGCDACHLPQLVTGRNPIAPLDRRPVRLYSDLLLHDLGDPAADVCSVGARPQDVRTTRLAGLRYRRQYMHDGQATSLAEALARHGGEADASRRAFSQLSEGERQFLFAFLLSL